MTAPVSRHFLILQEIPVLKKQYALSAQNARKTARLPQAASLPFLPGFHAIICTKMQ
jgi:hypothetical protein